MGAVVRHIFALCLSGPSTRRIATHLTAEGLPTPSQRHPDYQTSKKPLLGLSGHPTVRGILTNTAYIGQAVWGSRENVTKTTRGPRPESEWVRLTVPAIIDAETFHAAQTALQYHRAIATRNRKYAYLLCGGRLRCGRCGRGKTGICRKPDNSYYRCNSYHYIIDPVLRCPGVLRADVVESQVWAAVVRALDQPELISTALCTAEARQPHAGHDDRLEKRLRPTPRHGTLGTLALYGEGHRISASVDMHCIVPLHHV
jgi:site-specific DNA recombinase